MTEVLGPDVTAWWSELTGAALVGTARRAVPAPPGWTLARADDTPPEIELLDAVAVGGALRRAGVEVARHGTDEPLDAAEPDLLPLAPPRARQLLDLLLGQSPVGADLRPVLLRVWLRAAREHGVRAHHATLVRLLELGTTDPGLRDDLRPVLDRRGAWLATGNRQWSWAAPRPEAPRKPTGDVAWARLPTAERAVALRRARAEDPTAGRSLLETTWSSDSAASRATLIAALEVGLGPADEAFLDRALDDRAPAVREAAAGLLDGLPGSDRAQRMRVRLEPLVSRKRALGRPTLVVELPTGPDGAGARDGLGKAPRGRSERGLWLERIAAGAPLETWTAVTDLDPAQVVGALHRAGASDALVGVRRAALRRADLAWSRALVDHQWDPLLLQALPADEVDDRVRRRVAQTTTLPELLDAVRLLAPPWSREVSDRVAGRLAEVGGGYLLPEHLVLLARGLDPASAPAVQRAADRARAGGERLHHLAQHLVLVPTIEKAFA